MYAGTWNKRTVAVKKLHAISTRSDVKTFLREVSVLSKARHPNIVQLFGACLKSPHFCIVEEMMEGGSLHARLHETKRALSDDETLRVALDVASRRADLELSGAALGGRLRGSGTLAGEANHGRVVLDDELQCSLSLRFVSVRSAVYDPDAGTVTVCVKVPIFGERDILLREEHQHTRL